MYDGKAADIFSLGVCLFTLIQGIFPFSEAKKDEYFYKMILEGDLVKYWHKTGGTGLSDDFKDLVLKMFSYDPAKRPTIKEVKSHPWMQKPFNKLMVKNCMMHQLKLIGYPVITDDVHFPPLPPMTAKI